MLQAPLLGKLAGIRHGFFTRAGGVSQGVYASLNGGVGSNDAPDKVAENRARMATALGVAPQNLITPYQIHSPEVTIAVEPWTSDNRPRADGIVTQIPGLAIGVSTADCGPLLFADAESRRDRRGACRLARRFRRRDRSDGRRDGETRRQSRPRRRRVGPLPSARRITRSGRNSSSVSSPPMPAMRASSPPRRASATLCSISTAISPPAWRVRASATFEDLRLCTYADAERFYSFRRTTHPRRAGLRPAHQRHRTFRLAPRRLPNSVARRPQHQRLNCALPSRSERGRIPRRSARYRPRGRSLPDARPWTCRGIGNTTGLRLSTQASATALGAAPWRLAIESSSEPGLARSPAASGNHGMKPMPCCSQ